jgi:two-component system CheB/CheR fusion protein
MRPKSTAGRGRLGQTRAKPTATARGSVGAKSQPKAFPIVGIGASAGGYESFTRFLEALSVDSDMAFVLIQHLDPQHESKLTELLSRATMMPVIEVKQAMRVEPNHVYVIPPNKNLVIARGCFRLSPRRDAGGPPMPVDSFLRSLAEDQAQNAIGVILSGNGSDGTLGLEAIRGGDGLTFVEDPKTAKYPGMPASAIATGCVDVILPPERLARELTKLPRLGYAPSVTSRGSQAPAQPSGPLAKIYSILRAGTGVDFRCYKQTTLMRRIQRRMGIHRIEKLEDFVRYLDSHPPEVGALFDDALITVTRFFRDPQSFQVLVRKVFPALVKNRRRGRPIRVWVPACSSGEEVFSIAVSLLEFLGDRAGDYPLQMFGTDISETAIAKARAGVYRKNIALDVSAERLRRFFTITDDDNYRIAKSVRDVCVFARQDLSADPPFSRLDLVSCQNLLIYFGPELQKRVIPIFHYALQPHGFLLRSRAESIGGFAELFTQIDKQQRVYAKNSSPAKPERAFPARNRVEESLLTPQTESATTEPVPPEVAKVADRVLLQHYKPKGVVINANMQVLQFRGHTAPYLEHTPGFASLHLLKLVRNDLALPLRAILARALKQRAAVRQEIAWPKTKNQTRKLKVEVFPFTVPPAKGPFLLVLFEELPSPEQLEQQPARSGGRRGAANQAEMNQLRKELAATQESFQSAFEEQKAASEEIQSSNEELQSTNEELETAKEEMQSTNEELETVNEELRHINLETTRVNNDLINLLASVQIPLVMVDSNLTIRRFTPAARKFFNLIPTDLGRSLSDIKAGFDSVDLDKMILEVIDSLGARECEVRDRAGHWHLLRVRPYRTKDNKIDGAVLALFDIEEFKRSLEHISELMWSPFLALDIGLRVVRANAAFYDMFLTTREETEGRFIYDLGNGQWNMPRLRVLLEEMLPNNTLIKDFPVAHEFPKIGAREMLLNARLLDADESRKKMILLAFQDATPRGRNWQWTRRTIS